MGLCNGRGAVVRTSCLVLGAVAIAAIAVAIAVAAGPLAAPAPPVFPGTSWEKADPAKAGWALSKLNAVEDYVREIGSTAVMVVQDGRAIASFGDVGRKVHVRSVRKSVMSA